MGNLSTSILVFVFCWTTVFDAQAGRRRPKSVVTAESKGYATESEAAYAGLVSSVEQSKRYEYGGCIYVNKEGVYHYTKPVTNRRDGKVHFSCNTPKEVTVTAIFHTHPPHSRVGFSNKDVRQAKKHQVTSYIACLTSGDFRQYVAGRDRGGSFSEGVLLGRPF